VRPFGISDRARSGGKSSVATMWLAIGTSISPTTPPAPRSSTTHGNPHGSSQEPVTSLTRHPTLAVSFVAEPTASPFGLARKERHQNRGPRPATSPLPLERLVRC
jgi:hypothetical protein